MELRSERTPQQKASGDTGIAPEISLVRGGPFYRAQEALRLLTHERWNLGMRIAVAIGVGWVPLVVLTLLLKPHTIGDLLTDYVVNVRMLIAVPALLAGQILMENVFRMILRHIREAELLSSSDQAKMDLTILSLVRLVGVERYGDGTSFVGGRLVLRCGEPTALSAPSGYQPMEVVALDTPPFPSFAA